VRAEREHDRQDSYAHSHMDQLEAFALQGIKTLGLTSAGGIAAVLGFYSANYTRLSQTPHALDAVNKLLWHVVFVDAATLLCCLAGYFSQVFFTQTMFSRTRTYEHPYVQDGEKTDRYTLFGNIARTAAIIAALFSTLCLCIAGFDFLNIVR
jgi:hypothetical protein